MLYLENYLLFIYLLLYIYIYLFIISPTNDAFSFIIITLTDDSYRKLPPSPCGAFFVLHNISLNKYLH